MSGAIQSISKEADTLTRVEFYSLMAQIKRSKGRTAVAGAAYRAGEKLHNLWDGETHDYAKKGGVILAEIILWNVYSVCN